MDQTALQSLLDRRVGRRGVRNAVIHIRPGDGSAGLSAAAGIARTEDGTPMAADTPYLSASIAKTYTAAVILKLIESGDLSFETRAVDVLPEGLIERIHVYEGIDYTGELTIEHLLTQTSGLADYYEGEPEGERSLLEEMRTGGDRRVTTEDVIDIARRVGAAFAPGDGDKALYSDTNYRLLGEVYRAATNEPLAEGYRRHILEPLHLENTRPYADRGPIEPAAVFGGDSEIRWPLFLSSHLAEGGLIYTAADSTAFMQGFFGGRLFDRSLLERQRYRRIFTPLRYGIGTMRFKLPRIFSPFKPSPELLGHSGSTGSFAYWSPMHDAYVAGTVNQTASPSTPFQLILQVLGKL